MDTKGLPFPKPKDQKKSVKTKEKKRKEEFCIMPKSNLYEIERFPGSERHEVFEGRKGNREKSIEDGLVIFLTPEKHRTSSGAIHKDRKFSEKVQKIAEKTWCEYYHKTKEDFRKRYGKNYI